LHHIVECEIWRELLPAAAQNGQALSFCEKAWLLFAGEPLELRQCQRMECTDRQPTRVISAA
jgi:hypothetical protein